VKTLLLDNYDSFTYNLVHYAEQFSDDIEVFRNDEISLDAVDKYDVIILSPGPGLPKDAGIMPELIKRYSPTKKILGVCLGHQAIAEAFGGKLVNMNQVLHGVARKTIVTDKTEQLFKGLPNEFNCGRYHSWAVKKIDLPDCLELTALDENDYVMAFRHKTYDVCGVQFHPESILTENGLEIMENFFMASA
jgi:anthranilate synthase component 2